jgi:hypothetical protein
LFVADVAGVHQLQVEGEVTAQAREPWRGIRVAPPAVRDQQVACLDRPTPAVGKCSSAKSAVGPPPAARGVLAERRFIVRRGRIIHLRQGGRSDRSQLECVHLVQTAHHVVAPLFQSAVVAFFFATRRCSRLWSVDTLVVLLSLPWGAAATL